MHSTHDLRSDHFAITVNGRTATLDTIWPGCAVDDRLGVVVRQPGGATGASALMLAPITAFYDFHRARGGDFFVYPDFFVFHVGEPRGDHAMFDIWPDHKEVVVPAEAEAARRALNDRPSPGCWSKMGQWVSRPSNGRRAPAPPACAPR